MSSQVVVQYAAVVSLGAGVLGLALAVLIHHQQVTTQIFLELSARYDALLNTATVGLWTSPQGQLPAPTDELTVSVLRYCSFVSFSYFLFQQRRIPKKMWQLMLPSIERTLRSPFFVREWKTVSSEFQFYPEFSALAVSTQGSARPSGGSSGWMAEITNRGWRNQ
jgi:hypothetical protein